MLNWWGKRSKNGSIGDYFGLPTQVKNPIIVNALPARAYAMIYNEWFRDENLEAPLMIGYKNRRRRIGNRCGAIRQHTGQRCKSNDKHGRSEVIRASTGKSGKIPRLLHQLLAIAVEI